MRRRERSRQRRERERTEPTFRDLLEEIGVRPSKALGQNFLHDTRIVQRIAEVADLGPDDLVVEVGPGLGILTRELARRAGTVIAVELDTRLADHLRESLELENVRIVEGDILDLNLAELAGKRPYHVVANLPYSVAAAVIEHVLESDHRPGRMVVMVQREVAERIVARPPEMSVLAVAVQFYAVPRIAFRVGPGAFVPRPRVDSAVLRLDINPNPPLSGAERAAFFTLVRAGFSQRRKRLANALADALDLPKSVVGERLTAAGIDPDRRAETLSVEEWLAMQRSFGAHPSEVD
ncbi:16S rRNA (adenine(1518)-N(6)/adenine(1519)-N(6))-dimethyltransferase RsmA [Sphaerobacter thermophilus]|uniref:Ribosomal RNA small subunit methyltransferase A n=1 Tax=Sphaerobacter thermophilus (strain ATCC 49802 / DSM 20745 / KCCM 41009 / NCIMB 13125 / S 6022) TaxID=479434 RepID=D1C207_SPHTD|nr:16S rRNA (adenine(1518)-N(6)/adenine(1519)-N(6))-dimethyltransferase RsmA [Sphaerobacter thermophilus]ACZ38274.1 dimethyladenosine transferase [Sphaerobacter thermophilus DSM 20745]